MTKKSDMPPVGSLAYIGAPEKPKRPPQEVKVLKTRSVGKTEVKTAKIKLQEVMWAEMKPDVYGGKSCDQIIPQWSCYCAGDMEGEDGQKVLELAARTFPPGTKVIISEPLCPGCGERREPHAPFTTRKPLYAGPCHCGFDWDTWVRNTYS